MILKSLRVQNYKCIEDSNEFSIEPIICLVGKNESGKTALLQSLCKLNPDIKEEGKFDELREYPRRIYSEYRSQPKKEPANVLTTGWELEESDQEILIEKLGKNAFVDNIVEITKGYDNKTHYDLHINEKYILDYYYKKF